VAALAALAAGVCKGRRPAARLAEKAASRYGIRHAYLATDSEEMVRRASALSTSLRWFSGGASRERLQSAKLIEERVQAAELEPSAVVHGALVDLHFLARADVLIGHGGSMFSRLAFFLRWGRTGHVPPYVFVDGASGCCHPSSRACARLRNRTASGAGPPRALQTLRAASRDPRTLSKAAWRAESEWRSLVSRACFVPPYAIDHQLN